MVVATDGLIEHLGKWAQALHAGDFASAHTHAEALALAGELLTIHPEFVRCFTQSCNGADPHEVLLNMSQFLSCATAGRARHSRKASPRSRLGVGDLS